MSAKQLELHAVVKGRVQGVGFRYKALKFADSLKIKGTVRNLPEGSVEIYAQANQEVLEQLLTRLRKAFLQEIEEIEINYSDCRIQFTTFSILS